MRRTGAVVSGSAALALIHPQQFLPNDIDFYVLPFAFAGVLRYVEDHGYKIKPFDRSLCNYYHQNIVVIKLVHPVSHKSVNVTTGLDNHVVKLITRFHSTLVMNYLSWFGLVDLYPEWTMEKRGLIVTDNPASRGCHAKYVERGYTLYRDVFQLTEPLEEHICSFDPYCPTSVRSLHDGHSLVEPFDSNGFPFKKSDRDMAWSLPVPCSFNNGDN